MKIIDTHCHPYLNRDKKLEDILKNFFENNGENLIIIGTDLINSRKSLEIAKSNKKIFTTIGIHPCDIGNLDLENTILELENIYKENKEKIVAIGEIGLDYHWLEIDAKKYFEEGKIKNIDDYKKGEKEKQKLFFKGQIDLAKKLDLPIVIHNRNSKDDIFEILKEKNLKNFVFHCYSEDLDFAKKVIEFAPESMISFSGIITFKNASDIRQTAKNINIKNILSETDSPYLTPVPYRGKEENEPIYTKYIIEEIAKIRGEDIENVAKNIYNNSKRFFKI